jgi:hypothetical protein
LILRSKIVRGALLTAALIVSTTLGAHAATLEVVGPAGAELVRNGQVIGVLPLSAPVELPHGEFMIIQVRKQGFATHEEQVYLENPETALRVEVDLVELNRTTAVLSSALLAGTGQFYQGRRKTGMVHLGAQLVAWGSVVYGELQFKDKRDEYEKINQQYYDALVADDIAAILEERDVAWSEMEDAKSWRNWSIGAVVAIAAWSAFDAWRGHKSFHAAIESGNDSPDGATTAQVGLTWGFGGGVR